MKNIDPLGKPVRILIVDDHAIVREGLRAMIETKAGLVLAGEAANGEEAVLRARETNPDVILMDLVMPKKNGIEAIRDIKKENPGARILVLTSFADDDQVFSAIRGGALGYLLKDSLPGELLEAIYSVYRGEPSLHPAVARKLLIGSDRLQRDDYVQPPEPKESPASKNIEAEELLTEREIDVLRLMAKGYSNTEIAKDLYLGEGTVRFHVSNILSKLQLENRTQAVLYALRNGLAKLE